MQEPFIAAPGAEPGWMQRRDPRAKLLVALAYAVAVALARDWRQIAVAAPLALVLLALARPPLRALASRLGAVNLFSGFLWLTVPFSAPGEIIFRLGPLAATGPGVELAALITAKANLIMAVFIACAASSPLPELGRALASLGAPRTLVMILVFAYRYAHLLAEEARRLRTAALLRGFVPRSNLHTYRTYARLAAMTFVRGYDRAEAISQAMALRGFDGVYRSLNPPRPGLRDLALLAAGLASCLAVALGPALW